MTLLEFGVAEDETERRWDCPVADEPVSHSDSIPANIEDCLRRLTEIFQVLKAKTTASSAIEHHLNTLRHMHKNGVLWRLSGQCSNDANVLMLAKKLVQLYMSIPDRVAAVVDLPPGDILVHDQFSHALVNSFCENVVDVESWNAELIVEIGIKSGRLDYLVERAMARADGLFFAQMIMKCRLNPKVQGHLLVQICSNLMKRPSDNLLAKVEAAAECLNDLSQESPLTDIDNVFDCLSQTASSEVALLLIYVLAKNDETFKLLMSVAAKRWTLNAKTPSVSLQRRLTTILVICMGMACGQNKSVSFCEASILQGIHSRLDLFDDEASLCGKIIAELYASRFPTDRKLLFDLNGPLVDFSRQLYCTSATLVTAKEERSKVQDKFQETFKIEAKQDDSIEDFTGTEKPLKPNVTITEPFKGRIIDGDEEPRNAKVKRPRFLRDCLAYLKVTDDHNKQELAIQTLPDLYGQSSLLLRQELSGDIFRCLVYAKISEEQRSDALTMLCCQSADLIAPVLLQEAFSKNNSISQRLEVLTCVIRSLQVSTPNSNLQYQSKIKINTSSRMRLLELETFGEHAVNVITWNKVFSVDRLVSILVTPLSKLLYSQILSRGVGHELITEKLMLVIAAGIYYGGPTVTSIQLTTELIPCLQLLLSDASPIATRRLLQNSLFCLRVIVDRWSIPVINGMEFFNSCCPFLESALDKYADDHKISVLISECLIGISQLTDPKRLLEEFTSDLSISH